MASADLEQTATRLSMCLRRAADTDGTRPWYPVILRLLARGKPASPAQIAEAVGAPVEKVRERLGTMTDVETDDEGNLVGMGLTLRPTQHRFIVGGRQLYTWCALDTLMFPPLLGEAATVESPCRATGETVRVELGPEGVQRVTPPEAVVSIVVPEECCSTIRGSFCNEVHFFRSREAAADWQREHQEAVIVTVEEGFTLGRLLNRVLKK